MTLLHLIIDNKLFSVFVKSTGFSQEWVHPRSHRHFFRLTVPRKKKKHPHTKLWPQCRGMCWTVTFVKRSTPSTVSAICNKRRKKKKNEKKNGSLRVYFFQDEANSASTFTKVDAYMHTNEVKLFIFLWILLYIYLSWYLLKWLGWMEVIL